uniref:Cadherin domain-containing protein n=1 Tax=Syphacia muris TaxID=451379 RepID=A0A0N5ATG1_9BILA
MRPDHIRVKDEYRHNGVYYYIASEEQNLPFYIRNNTAEIIIFGNIDREQRSNYEFNIIAVDRSTISRVAKTHVTVQILDVNDNVPAFQDPLLAIPLRRNAPVNHLIVKFKAVDADSGPFGEVRYSLSNYSDIFNLSEKTGELRLKNSLTTTDESVYYTSVIANDLGKPSLKSQHNFRIEVFEDDKVVPEFRSKRYTASIRSDATVGTVIMQVVAGVEPYKYRLEGAKSKLFEIDDNGVIRLADTPKKTEHNQIYSFNVTATNNNLQQSTTQAYIHYVEIQVEGDGNLAVTENPQTPKQCKFTSKQFDAEVYENQMERKKILQLSSNCNDAEHIYVISQGTSEFEVDPKTGELYAVKPLDREKRSIYFLVVDIVEAENITESRRQKRQKNIIELMKAKLQPWQALVTVRVLDRNDNIPYFTKTNVDGAYVYSVDWQAPLLTPIARIQAEDADERTPLRYSVTAETAEEANSFMLNHTSGVLSLAKSLINSDKDVFRFDVMVTDGIHNVTAPVSIYKLSPQTNVVLVAVDKNHQDIEEWIVERKVSEQLKDAKFNILVKQPFVDDEGVVNPSNINFSLSTLQNAFVCICNRRKKQCSVGTRNTQTFCKRRSGSQVTDSEYMIDSRTAGPRPYNVDEINRKTAQSVLSSRPLPNPFETKDSYDAQMRSSSAFSFGTDTAEQRSLKSNSKPSENIRLPSNDSYSTAGPRSKNFSGNVEQVHTLINQESQERHNNDEQDYRIDETMFPVYRYQGYQQS